MSVTPEILFPSGLKEFKGNPKFLLGSSWYVDSTSGRQYGFKTIMDIDISLLPHGSYTAENPMRIPICTWENGLVMKLSMYMGSGIIYANLRLSYNNQELTYQQHVSAGWAGLSNSPYAYQPMLATQATGHQYTTAKLMVFNDYGNQPPTENVTPVQDFSFSLWIPSYRNITTVPGEPEVLVYNDLSRIIEGTTRVEFGQGGLLEADRSSAGSQRCDPYRGGWVFNNLTQFNTFMRSAGQGMSGDAAGGDSTEPDTPEDDPSQPGGGGGTYDPTSDPIDFPSLPTGGALSSGAIKAFLMSTTVTRQLFEKLWDSSIFDIALQFQKLVDNPMDCIISLHAIPVVPTIGAVANIKIGSFDTQISSAVITNQYLTIDCGSLNIREFWGSALDYSPYTTCEIYLPFIGIQKLKVEDVMKSTVHIKYNVDVFTGDCLCNIKCGKSVLYKFSGNLKQDIPVSGRANNMGIKGLLGTAQAFTGAAIGASMGTPPVLAGVAAGISSASSVASSKIITSRSGNLSGSVGLLDDFRPFFIFHRPVQSLASNFKTFKGYPSNITRTLSNVSGYTEVEYINLQNIPNATSAEMDEIKSILTSGAIF